MMGMGHFAEWLRRESGPFYEHVKAGRWKAARQVLKEMGHVYGMASYEMDCVLVHFDQEVTR